MPDHTRDPASLNLFTDLLSNRAARMDERKIGKGIVLFLHEADHERVEDRYR